MPVDGPWRKTSQQSGQRTPMTALGMAYPRTSNRPWFAEFDSFRFKDRVDKTILCIYTVIGISAPRESRAAPRRPVGGGRAATGFRQVHERY